MDEMIMRKVRASSVGANSFVLVPVHEIYDDELSSIPQDTDLRIVANTPRNAKQHRLAWCLAKLVSESCDWLPDKDSAMDWLKIKARHVKIIQDPATEQIAIIPKSIAFASLSQQAFKRVLDRMIFITCAEIIPGLDEGDLRGELEAMCGHAASATAAR